MHRLVIDNDYHCGVNSQLTVYMNRKLQIVSGKGGVGKSMVAAALAQKQAAQGYNTLLVSFGQVQFKHPVYNKELSYEPQCIKENLHLAQVDARLVLKEYIRRKMVLSFLYQPVFDNAAVIKLLDALPLFNELLSLGKLCDLVGEKSPFERVVFDAPATGHVKILFNVPEVASKTLVAGPIYSNALKILDMLRNIQTTELVIVTLAEEAPTREAYELFLFAKETAQVACDRLIVNRFTPARFTDQELQNLEQWARADQAAAPFYDAARYETSIARSQATQLEWLCSKQLPVMTLPEITTESDDRQELVYELVQHLDLAHE